MKELSQKTGISQGSLSNYLKESASIPSADVAVKIAKALNVTVEYLFLNETSEFSQSNIPYSVETRLMADKIENMSERDKKLVKALINEISNLETQH